MDESNNRHSPCSRDPSPRPSCVRIRTFHELYMPATYACDLLSRYGSNGKNESSGLDPLPSPPALVTLDGVHMLPDMDMDPDEEERGVEQEKLEPTVIVCDTCGRCERGRGRGKSMRER